MSRDKKTLHVIAVCVKVDEMYVVRGLFLPLSKKRGFGSGELSEMCNSPRLFMSTSLFCGWLISTAAYALPYEGLSLIDVLQSAPEGTWITIDGNFNDVSTPLYLRPASPPHGSPNGIFSSWGAMAWNSKTHDIVVTGGGHATYGGNDVYAWSAHDLKWRRLSLPSQVVQIEGRQYETADGPANSPIASHLYDGLVYLPVADRIMSFGGAAYNTGYSYVIFDPALDAYRLTGPYTFDINVADGDSVGGLDGSGADPLTLGTQAWKNRDSVVQMLDMGFTGSFVGTSSHVIVEDGKDAVIFRPSRNAGAELWKLTIHNPEDAASDTYERVGLSWVGNRVSGAGAYDPTRQIFVQLDAYQIYFWDLSSGVPQRSERVILSSRDGTREFDTFSTINAPGIDYDPIRDLFWIWQGFRSVWALRIPDDPNQPWAIAKYRPNFAFRPSDIPHDNTNGVNGSWQYIPEYDVLIGLPDDINGDVAIFKPLNWQPPFHQ